MKNPANAFRLGADILVAMRRLQARDGIGLSEQVRRALGPWLMKKGVLKKPGRKQSVGSRAR